MVKGAPEPEDEQFVVIRDNIQGKAVLTVPVLKEKCSKIFSRDVRPVCNPAEIRTKMVSHRDDAVHVTVFRQWANEVNGNGVAATVRYGKWMKRSGWFAVERLVALIVFAGWNIGLFDLSAHV